MKVSDGALHPVIGSAWAVEKRKISCDFRESKPDSCVAKPVTQVLYRLSCLSSCTSHVVKYSGGLDGFTEF
jgi:hypothetical protein